MRGIDTKLGKMAVYELGEGPAVFLWPSLYVDHESLLPIARGLARTRRCIVVDGPGHGRSASPSQRYSLRDCAQAAIEILDALGVEVVDWIGNAWGGHVGVLTALAAPARTRSLTVIGSPLHALEPSMQVKSRFLLALLACGARDLAGKLVGKAMIAPASHERHLPYVRRCLREAPAGGIAQAVRSISLGREDLLSELPRVGVPCLFIAGTDDPLLPVEVARREADLVPASRFETVPSAAHLVPLERPEETLAYVASFLSAVTERAEPGENENYTTK